MSTAPTGPREPSSACDSMKMKENVGGTKVHVLTFNHLLSHYFAVDRCPMYFDDGSNPWKVEENHIRVFRFDDTDYSHSSVLLPSILVLTTPAFLQIFT